MENFQFHILIFFAFVFCYFFCFSFVFLFFCQLHNFKRTSIKYAQKFPHCLFWQPSIQWNELRTGHPIFSFRFSLSCSFRNVNKLASVKVRKVLEYYIIKLIFIINLQCWLTSLKDGFDDEYHGRPDWENRGSLVSHPHRFVQGIYLTNKEALTVLCSVIKHAGSG